MLYYIAPSAVATQIPAIFNITGTPSAPAANISLVGLGFRDTRYVRERPRVGFK